MLTAFLTLLLGLAVLLVGGELLVRGSSRSAATLGLSPLVVGLTVVALGTSAPELAVSVAAAWRGDPDLGVGNVVGSNIFNVLVVLGLSALVAPLVVARQLLRFDVPVMVGASLLLLMLGQDGSIGRGEGLLLAALLAGYLIYSVRSARPREEASGEAAARPVPKTSRLRTMAWSGLGILVGLVGLVVGSRWFVSGAAEVARSLGVDELIIGLTVVAAGTSAPEVVTSAIAAVRGERDIAVGNVVGSSIFNILAVLGVSAAIAPSALPIADAAASFDVPVMILVALLAVPLMSTGYRVSRREGALLVGTYVAYVGSLILQATGHEAARLSSVGLLGLLLLLTVGLSAAAVRRTGLPQRLRRRLARRGDQAGSTRRARRASAAL